MSNYRDFIEDFPSRCKDLLLLAHEQAASNDREVTLSLMVASAGFLVPFERLRGGGLYIQPTRGRETFPEPAANLDHLLDQPWAEFGKPGANSWATGPSQSPDKPMDSWPELGNLQPPSQATTVAKILTIMRHALAHGNIYTRPTREKKIQAIIFVSRGENRRTGRLTPYEFVYVSPSDFRNFLLTWFDLIATWNISQEEIVEALETAA